MAVEKVTRVLVAVHNDRRERFLASLQRQGVLHVVQAGSSEPGARQDRSERLVRAVEALMAQGKKKGKASGPLSRDEYDALTADYDHEGRVAALEARHKELADIEARQKAVASELDKLAPWAGLKYDPQELYNLRNASVQLGRFPSRAELDAAVAGLEGRPAALELVAEHDGAALAMVAAQPGAQDSVQAVLSAHRFEPADLRYLRGRPGDVIAALGQEAQSLAGQGQAVRAKVAEVERELPRLKAAADAMANDEARRAAADALAKTDSVSVIHGWVRTRHLPRLQKLVDETGVAALAEVAPGPDEQPPVALANRPAFRPFEMVLELFSMPSPTELDPTWLIAPFFGIFFAICLTDAGYGIVVAVATYALMRRMGMSNKLLGIVLVGAILTIPAGALVGGWFGDVPDRLGVAWVQALKNRMMWFDPVKDPMKFFIISVALGYLQMIAGIVFEIADCLRVKNFGDGLLVQLPWFLFLNGLTARVLLAKSLPAWALALVVAAVLLSVAAIVVFTQRSRETALSQALWFGLIASFFLFIGARLRWLTPEYALAKWAFFGLLAVMLGYGIASMVKSRKLKVVPAVFGVAAVAMLGLYFARVVPAWLPSLAGAVFFSTSPAGSPVTLKLLWGGYALYGATGYIGVVLSYIRLMALGMCTGGVAVAINVIAWMVMPVPVVGIVLALIVLVIGHTYNIAVNVLGAFVHSLRLQYVEFFPRFYAGGGEPFVPFRERFQFVKVKS